MKFDAALQALVHTAWDWTEGGFEAIANRLGLVREPDADPEMPGYVSPWGKEWVQAIIDEGQVERLEVLVEDKSPRWRPFTARKLDAIGRKFRDKHDAYVKRIGAVKGTPSFVGEHGTAGFPADEDAHVLALWPAENARLMLTLRNEGPDTPFWISLVLRPPATGRAPTARPSWPSLHAAPLRQSTSAIFRPGGPRPATPVSDARPLDARYLPALETIQATRWDWSADALPSQVDNLGPAALLHADGRRIELVLESTSPPSGGFTIGHLDALDQEYCERFERYVEAAKGILGRPKFNDGPAATGFPKDENAQFLALWPLKTARVMVLYASDGRDKPFTLTLVVTPR